MKCMMKKLSCIAFSITLFLLSAACAEQPASQKPQPDSSPSDDSTAAPEAVPQESEVKYQTYQVPIFGIEFDCPADFASEVESNIISEDQVSFSVKEGDRYVQCMCSRIASQDEWASLSALIGEDSTALYEHYQSLDVAAAIASEKEEYGFKTFELLDSFSTPDSYGFFYIAEDGFGDVSGAQLGYRYKNYGSFGEPNDLIRVDLEIDALEEGMDRDDFIALCEAVTSSLRLSDGGASASDVTPSAELGGDFEVGGSFEAALEPLKGGTYEEQCAEIVDALFHYAPLAGYDGPRLYLEQLLGGNEELFDALDYSGGLLEGEDNFDSEIVIENCAQSPAAGGVYYIDVTETRCYAEKKLGIDEYVYAFEVSINSPTDYCITGIAYQLVGHQDGTGTPVDGEYDGADSSYDSSQSYGSDELAMQRSYGANARINEYVFYYVLQYIQEGDRIRALNEFIKNDYYAGSKYDYWYQNALQLLEQAGYTDTPLYDLALSRLLQAWGDEANW